MGSELGYFSIFLGMKKALLLLLFVSGLAYGQINDCEKTLVFEKTYDFNERLSDGTTKYSYEKVL